MTTEIERMSPSSDPFLLGLAFHVRLGFIHDHSFGLVRMCHILTPDG